MDGALPGVVGGLVDCPVIAVPTSVGYGASFGGLAALLTILLTALASANAQGVDSPFSAFFVFLAWSVTSSTIRSSGS